MKALVVGDTLIFDPHHPEPDPAEAVMVRVTTAGICNTDLEIVRGYMNFRGVLGHEFSGVVETGAWAGQRVAGEINVSCGTCEFCHRGITTQCANRTTVGIDRHDGVFAERVVLPIANLHPLPDNVSDDQAVFVEPLAAALQTLDQTHISPHHRVILIGAGKLGLLTAQVLGLTGCHLTVIARHQRQHDLLQKWGLEAAFPGEVKPRSADVVVDCTGTPEGFEDALHLVKARGIIHLKSTYNGLPAANLTRVVVDEVRIETSRCGSFPAAIRLLARGLIDVESMIEGRFPLEQGLTAMERAAQKGTLKILLDIT